MKEKKSLWDIVKRLFVAGLLTSLPIILTIYIAILIIGFFDDIVASLFIKNTFLENIPGVGIVITIIFMVIVGLIATNLLGDYLLKLFERLIWNKIPFVKGIYNTIKQVFSTILSNDSKAFKEVVLVQFPSKGIWSLAFVTSDASNTEVGNTIGGEDIVSLFLPTTPNPTSGFLLFVSRKELITLNMKPDVAMKLIVSGGVLNSTKNTINNETNHTK